MRSVVYILDSAIFAFAGILLLGGYWRGRQRLLFWSGLCFSLLAVSNLVIFIDLVVIPTGPDLYLVRLLLAAVAMALLLFGLIWESDRVR